MGRKGFTSIPLIMGIAFLMLGGGLLLTDYATAEQSILGVQEAEKPTFTIEMNLDGLDLDCSDGLCEYHYGYYRVFDKSGKVLASNGPIILEGNVYKDSVSFDMSVDKAAVVAVISRVPLSLEENQWKIGPEEVGIYDVALAVTPEEAAEQPPAKEAEKDNPVPSSAEPKHAQTPSDSFSSATQQTGGIKGEGRSYLFYGYIGSFLMSLASFVFFGVSKLI